MSSNHTTEDVYPRDLENRYRIYAVVGASREILATAATASGVGLALITLHDDQRSLGRRLADHGRIGVMDVMPGGEPAAKGEWIVTPWDRRPA